MKKTIAVMMLLGGGLFAAPHISFGIGFGVSAPVEVARPASPGPGYTWVDGYYASNGGWTQGYWAPPAVVREPVFAPDNVRFYDRDHGFYDRDHGFRERNRGFYDDRDHGFYDRDHGFRNRDVHFDHDRR
jgi:hypothetical protein